MFSQDQIKELKDRVSKLEKALDIKLEIEELNKKHLISQDSNFWQNQKNAETKKAFPAFLEIQKRWKHPGFSAFFMIFFFFRF